MLLDEACADSFHSPLQDHMMGARGQVHKELDPNLCRDPWPGFTRTHTEVRHVENKLLNGKHQDDVKTRLLNPNPYSICFRPVSTSVEEEKTLHMLHTIIVCGFISG